MLKHNIGQAKFESWRDSSIFSSKNRNIVNGIWDGMKYNEMVSQFNVSKRDISTQVRFMIDEGIISKIRKVPIKKVPAKKYHSSSSSQPTTAQTKFSKDVPGKKIIFSQDSKKRASQQEWASCDSCSVPLESIQAIASMVKSYKNNLLNNLAQQHLKAVQNWLDSLKP